MLNRRDVILSAAAMITGCNRAAATSAYASMFGTVRSESSRDRGMTAAACSECATACSVLTRFCVERVVAGETEFAALQELSHNCGDICNVAATLLRREGALAPAICQACADACDRLVERCSTLTASEIQHCDVSASRCAIACRAIITGV
ncbi:MAG: hypothetical protein GY758_10435 [Fuerstiella sp.]|nr:hypothetical protein [Fuerstiella sp.]MCP4782183.1 hypothetical protein [Fuerstiella sp.]MCP4859451.1 hypothetical protein [Fuerstiella sp.]